MDEVAVIMKTWASYVAMVVVQVAYGGANIIVKIALAKGMNQQVLLVYRNVLAVLLLAPFAYVLERYALDNHHFYQSWLSVSYRICKFLEYCHEYITMMKQ